MLIRSEPDPMSDNTKANKPEPKVPAERYPENAPGPFYVEKDMCIICRVPESEAPDLMGFYEDPTGGGSHCYFKKQPETPEEVERAIAAVRISCCGALWYDGDDPEILRRLNEGG